MLEVAPICIMESALTQVLSSLAVPAYVAQVRASVARRTEHHRT